MLPKVLNIAKEAVIRYLFTEYCKRTGFSYEEVMNSRNHEVFTFWAREKWQALRDTESVTAKIKYKGREESIILTKAQFQKETADALDGIFKIVDRMMERKRAFFANRACGRRK